MLANDCYYIEGSIAFVSGYWAVAQLMALRMLHVAHLILGAIQVSQCDGGQLAHLDEHPVVCERRVRLGARHQPGLRVRVEGNEYLEEHIK